LLLIRVGGLLDGMKQVLGGVAACDTSRKQRERVQKSVFREQIKAA
jgi:hypothetical protein